MPCRKLSITLVVLALVGALLTSLMPPTYAERKERANGKSITSGEEVSRGKERTQSTQRSAHRAPPATNGRSTGEELTTDEPRSGGEGHFSTKELPDAKKRPGQTSAE